MLFDLRSRRRSAIRVLYSALATLMLVGFVAFGVGSEAGVGVFGGHVGIGHVGADGGGPSSEEHRALLQRVERAPRDTAGWRSLVLASEAAVFHDAPGGHRGA